jgi:hypothetical protein
MYLLLEFGVIGAFFLISMFVCFAMNKDTQRKKITNKVM